MMRSHPLSWDWTAGSSLATSWMPNSIACIITRTFSFFLAVSSTGALLGSDAQNECHKNGRCRKEPAIDALAIPLLAIAVATDERYVRELEQAPWRIRCPISFTAARFPARTKYMVPE